MRRLIDAIRENDERNVEEAVRGPGLEPNGLRPGAERQAPPGPSRAGLPAGRAFAPGCYIGPDVIFYAALDGGLGAKGRSWSPPLVTTP